MNTSWLFFYVFKAYLKSGDDFNYTANIMKLADVDNPTKFVKEQFQKVFIKNVNESFELIWSNQNLRKKLFQNGIPEEDAKLDFKDLINNTDSNLYNFIKVE